MYDDYTHEFISETSKFIIFPDFDGEPFRVMIDQHWVETENGRKLEGFSLLWDEDRELSNTVIKMDLFQPNQTLQMIEFSLNPANQLKILLIT